MSDMQTHIELAHEYVKRAEELHANAIINEQYQNYEIYKRGMAAAQYAATMANAHAMLARVPHGRDIT